MPISGHEESGVKSFAGQFSDLVAGVPIKKRRPRPSSPPSEELCSITEETELQRKENSSTSQGSTLSNVSIAGAPPKKRRFRPSLQASSPSLEKALPQEKSDALQKEHSSTSLGSTLSTSSAGLSDTIRNPVFEEKKASSVVTNADIVLKNSSFLVPKLEESNPATPSCLLDVVDSKEKVVLNEGIDKNSGSQTIKGNPELLLAAKEGLALGIGADVSKQIVQDTIKQEGSVVPGSTNLSLSLKEHLFPAVTSPEINEIHKKMEKGETVSLELSLSKEECSTHSSNTDSKSNSDTTRVHSSRANWDLNTTMDAWDEGSDASSVKTSIDGLNITHSAFDENQLTCSIGMTPPIIVSVKQTFKESQNKAFITSSAPYGQQYKCVDPRNLSLSPYLSKYDENPSRISVKLNSGCATPIVSLPRMAATAGDANTSSFRLVKPEPQDDNPKKDLKEGNVCPVTLLDSVAIKKEFIQHSIVKPSKSFVSNSKLVAPTFIKSEPSHEGRQERSKTAEISTAGQLVKLLHHGPFTSSSSSSSSMTVPAMLNSTQVSAEGAHLAAKSVFTAELTTGKNIGQLENCVRAEEINIEKVYDEVSSNAEPVPLVTVAIPMVGTGTKLTNLGLKHSSLVTKKEDAEDHDGCRLKLMNELPDPRDSGEGCVSDEEKITLSADMLEDDSYGSDFESDDNHAVTVAVDTERYIEDDDYEDGEVREPLEPSKVEDAICEVREVECPDSGNYDNKPVEKGVVSGDYPTSSRVVENNNKTVIHNEIIGKDGVDILMHEKPGKVIYKNVCVQESLDGEKSDIAADNRQVNVLQRKPLDLSERIIVSETQETEQPSDGSHVIDVQCADEVVKTTDIVRQTNLDLSKMEGSANNEDITKDVGNSGNQGRIIDLSRAASSSSPSKTRPISGRSLPTRAGRDVLSDTLDGDKLYRGRDEVYIEAPPHKFSRERHQDMSTRNSRMNFGRGRGRVNSRIRGDWESERDYSGEFYNGPSQQFRGARSKYQSAIADNDLEYNNVGPDDSYVVNGRLGRKSLNDGSYIAPRRRSPGGGRDGIQMGHRNPRPISPNSRCIGGDGSEIVGMRHSDKFMRGFPDDTLSSVYTRPQQFEGMDGRFSRGRGRNFSSMQRRGGISRMRSKSPIRSRSRSPGQWSSPRRRSPRRRSPEGFGGHQEMTHRRSPLYRVDRMRSPDRPVFTGERVVRRHGSPPFISRPSNDMRDIDSARDHGHPRSVISNRSPSGRILIRNNRRFDVVDPRDRADNDDEYFTGGGPMHSGRMLELNGEGNGEERRRFGERRGPVRSFRPPYNNNNNNGNNAGDNFHLNGEDGPRHYRFCSDDSDFHERSNNMRERDFDRRIKGRTGNGPPRRTRNMDDQEENFRHGGQQVWSDDSFDDISRVKRKRF